MGLKSLFFPNDTGTQNVPWTDRLLLDEEALQTTLSVEATLKQNADRQLATGVINREQYDKFISVYRDDTTIPMLEKPENQSINVFMSEFADELQGIADKTSETVTNGLSAARNVAVTTASAYLWMLGGLVAVILLYTYLRYWGKRA